MPPVVRFFNNTSQNFYKHTFYRVQGRFFKRAPGAVLAGGNIKLFLFHVIGPISIYAIGVVELGKYLHLLVHQAQHTVDRV